MSFSAFPKLGGKRDGNMKIGIDAGALCSRASGRFGTYRYTEELLAALSTYGSNAFTYMGFSFCPLARRSKVRVYPVYPRFGWTAFALPLNMYLRGVNIFLAVNQALPAWYQGKTIVISHGLSFRAFPAMYHGQLSRLNDQLEHYVRRADHIVVSSTRVQEELIHYEESTAGRIVVLPFGIHPQPVKREVDASSPYFLYAGSDQPIKNLSFLFRAFCDFRKAPAHKNVRLVLAGPSLPSVPEGVSQIGHVPQDRLYMLYSGALAYVTASYYESFNYPVLEALTAGCPVIGTPSAVTPEMQPFVVLASSHGGFANAMRQAAASRLPAPNPAAVAARFSWRSYVQALEALFV